MPIVTVTVLKPKTPAFKARILDAVHGALVASGAHANDRFHRVLELDSSDFRFDSTFPDLTSARDDNFVLVEVLLGVGRSVKVKKKIVQDTLATLTAGGLNAEHVMVVFQDVAWENWSPGGGRFPGV